VRSINLPIKKKLEEAGKILSELKLPEVQQNDRSKRVFLALANVEPLDDWSNANSTLLTTAQIMKFIASAYNHSYAINTRESIRKETLHQFEQAGLIERNRDDPPKSD